MIIGRPYIMLSVSNRDLIALVFDGDAVSSMSFVYVNTSFTSAI